jgi:hypothetical protein
MPIMPRFDTKNRNMQSMQMPDKHKRKDSKREMPIRKMGLKPIKHNEKITDY